MPYARSFLNLFRPGERGGLWAVYGVGADPTAQGPVLPVSAGWSIEDAARAPQPLEPAIR
jgi:hypothetical protein